MSYDIIVRFPDKDTAEEFTAQMCDGWGEGFCNFTPWRLKPEAEGKAKKERGDFEQVTDSAPKGTEVYFVKDVFNGQDEY